MDGVGDGLGAPQAPRQSSARTYLFFALAGIILLAVLGAYFVWPGAFSGSLSAPPNAYQALVSGNADFVRGESLRAQGDFAGALAAYQAALSKAANAAERGQVMLFIGYADERLANIASAVAEYLSVAGDEANTPIIRAYALTYLGRLYYSTYDFSITDAVFKSAPYASLAVSGDVDASYRNLFEYAASLYPLAEPELHAAFWYYYDAANLKQSQPSSPKIAADTATIEERLDAADADIARMQADASQSELLPEILGLKAALLSGLAFSNIGSYSGQQAESAYQDALGAYASSSDPAGDGVTRGLYASFLAVSEGKARAGDIAAILAPLMTPSYASAPITALLKNPALDQTGFAKPHLVLLARLDPGFKAYLVSLGWKEADFSR